MDAWTDADNYHYVPLPSVEDKKRQMYEVNTLLTHRIERFRYRIYGMSEDITGR